MSTALPLQEQYNTYELFQNYSILQFEVDFKQHCDLITMMMFTLLHFVFFFAVLH